jgi:hypothetical protein
MDHARLRQVHGVDVARSAPQTCPVLASLVSATLLLSVDLDAV